MNDICSLVELDHITHAFGDREVLSDVSIAFKKDSITAVLGKSGSGKSTLLQIINGMVHPSQGNVFFKGQPLAYEYIHTLRLQMGYVVQQVGLFPHLTILENIGLLGRISKIPEQEIHKRVKELMDMVRLPAVYLGKYPHELSGGEQQRAGLCRAMLLRPPLLLMDEPFASLDYSTKQGIYDYLLDIQRKESRTIILVTHDWEESVKLADHFAWLSDGKIKKTIDKSVWESMKSDYLSEL